MQRSVCTPLCAGTSVPAGGGSWSHLSLYLFCLGCDRRAAAQEDKSGRNVAPVRFLRCVTSSQKDKSGRSVVPLPGLQNAHIPRDWEPATNRDICTVSYARVTDASGRLFPIIVSLKDISESVTVYVMPFCDVQPTSIADEFPRRRRGRLVHPDEHSSRCQLVDEPHKELTTKIMHGRTDKAATICSPLKSWGEHNKEVVAI
ncbi:hypothetical protein DPMN_099848 [Dreissena polymorpha]|uniref:Uncharacterized protein n=1 Tax=Dreissena polymorpha TaxID=45954 RepID=A0A9D4LEN5_DREPO|nr:hypothetical protein DPMN_099848 [Dreissena polymorpha]